MEESRLGAVLMEITKTIDGQRWSIKPNSNEWLKHWKDWMLQHATFQRFHT